MQQGKKMPESSACQASQKKRCQRKFKAGIDLEADARILPAPKGPTPCKKSLFPQTAVSRPSFFRPQSAA
jgi:hypothetical protein